MEKRLRVLLGAALLSGLALSPRLWVADRAYPTVPVFGWLPQLPQVATLMLLVVMVAGVFAPGRWALVTPVAGGMLALFDMSRLQPWFYQYMLLFIVMSLGRKEAVGVVLAAVYVWSGLQKANAAFIDHGFADLVRPLANPSSIGFLAYAVPVVEVAIGVCLVAPRLRKIGVIGAVAMHAFLLLALGPLGADRNSVIWPWNIWMAAMVLVFFWSNAEPLQVRASVPVFVLVWVMPALNFFGLWDDYLSASLYSGRAAAGWLHLTDGGLERLAKIHPTTGELKARKPLAIYDWSMAELNVPPYPETRFYRAVARQLKRSMPEEKIQLTIAEKPGLTEAKPQYVTTEF